jgi:choline monooxygenase
MADPIHINPDVARAHTLPSTFYTSPAVYEQLNERVLARAWHLVGHEQPSAPRQSGRPFTLLPGSLDEPLVFLRDADGEAHLLSNVCTHRANLVLREEGDCRGLRCHYHGRRFDLDGTCVRSPEFEDAHDFPGPAYDLPSLPQGRLGELLFTSLSPALTFDTWSGPLRELIAPLLARPMEFDARGSEDYHVDAHWALYVDNYLEGFHIPFVHPGLSRELELAAYRTELQPWSNVQLAPAREGAPSLTLASSDEPLAACYAWLFPNLMLNFYPWGLSVNVVEPLGPASTRVRFLRYVARPELLTTGAGGDLDGVQREDEEVVEAVQRGVRSRLYRAGRFSPRSEVGVHQFHSLLAKTLSDWSPLCASS